MDLVLLILDSGAFQSFKENDLAEVFPELIFSFEFSKMISGPKPNRNKRREIERSLEMIYAGS